MKTQYVYLSIAVACLLAISIAGCGDDGKKVQDAGLDGGGGGESITFIVVEWSTDSEDWVPMEGATVAFDAPGGERTETVSGADGKVTFDGIDWTLGTAAATAHQPDYALGSVVNIDPSNLAGIFTIDDVIALRTMLIETETPEMVTVSGTATGLVDADNNNIDLFPFRAYGEYYGGAATDSYEFSVEKDAPFTLVGIEETAGALPSNTGYFLDIDCAIVLDHEAISEDSAVLDLDFSSSEIAADLLRADGSIVLPEREDSSLRDAWSIVWVQDWNSNSISHTGWAETIDFSADGNAVDVSYVWVEPELLEKPYTYYQVWNNTTNEGSLVFKEGYPEAGELEPRLLDVPAWVTPSGPGPAHPLHDALEWEIFDDEVTDVALNLLKGEVPVWQINAPTNATSMTVPEPPSTVDQAELLGTGILGAQLYTGVPHSNNYYWERLALSKLITIIQPELEGDYWEDGACFGDPPNQASSPDCNGVTFEGCCDEEAKVIWCEDEALYCVNCPSEHEIDCGWNGTESYYDCSDEPGGEDPSAEHPIECP